jgi:uncharacterized membrane protein YjgN (DUF898 family)
MTVAEETAYPFTQRASVRELVRLAFQNAALSLLTLTLYRFWARTHMRRRLWARTEVLGDPLEYNGSGMELVRGFAISLPTFFVPAVFVLYLAPLAFDPGTAALMLLVFYACAIPLMGAARFWMRRYQLSRTRWRGIRFALNGSAWSYAFASAGWTILQVVTLGWFTPAARMRRARLLWEGARFGDQPFHFAAGEQNLSKGLYGPFALAWFGTPFGFLLGAITGAIISGLIALLVAPAMLMTPGAEPPVYLTFALGIVMLVFAMAGVVLVWTPYFAAAMQRTAALIQLDGARFELRITRAGLAGVTLAGALIFIFSLGLLAPLAGALYARYVLGHLYLIGQPRFAEIGQPIVSGPASGEGMADAFDLDFGIGVV